MAARTRLDTWEAFSCLRVCDRTGNVATDQAKIGHYGLTWAFSPTLQQTDTVVNVYIEAEIEFKLTK